MRRQGHERWANLPLGTDPRRYSIYERSTCNGARLRRNPYAALVRLDCLVSSSPAAASSIERLWLDMRHEYVALPLVQATLKRCVTLRALSLPWTCLRLFSAETWRAILRPDSASPLRSLELMCGEPSLADRNALPTPAEVVSVAALNLDLSGLRRLKLFGHSSWMPVNDDDLAAMANTATHLEEFHLTRVSSISIRGVMAIVRASRDHLRILDYSPRAPNGVTHPDPGELPCGEHACEQLAACPRLVDLSVSLPSVCPALFTHSMGCRWEGECQVRAQRACCSGSDLDGENCISWRADTLARTLRAARQLSAARRGGTLPTRLNVELFYAGCVLEPAAARVHGDWDSARALSAQRWPNGPLGRAEQVLPSGHGPAEPNADPDADDAPSKSRPAFESVTEDMFLEAAVSGWVRVP